MGPGWKSPSSEMRWSNADLSLTKGKIGSGMEPLVLQHHVLQERRHTKRKLPIPHFHVAHSCRAIALTAAVFDGSSLRECRYPAPK